MNAYFIGKQFFPEIVFVIDELLELDGEVVTGCKYFAILLIEFNVVILVKQTIPFLLCRSSGNSESSAFTSFDLRAI